MSFRPAAHGLVIAAYLPIIDNANAKILFFCSKEVLLSTSLTVMPYLSKSIHSSFACNVSRIASKSLILRSRFHAFLLTDSNTSYFNSSVPRLY